MNPPENQTENTTKCRRDHEKPTELGNAYQTHQQEANHDEQADWIAGPLAATVAAKGYNFGRTRFLPVSRRFLVVLVPNPDWKFHASLPDFAP
jgi:hypothetical protein